MLGRFDPHGLGAEEEDPREAGRGRAVTSSRRCLRLWIAKKQDEMEILPDDSPLEEAEPPPKKHAQSLKQDVHLLLCRRLAALPVRNRGPFWRPLIDFLFGN